MTGIALAWGLAEATLFFVIPDVLLTWVAIRRGAGRALRLAGWATAGAAVGGLLMWAWGAGAAPAMQRLPAIDAALVADARAAVAADGNAALVAGAFTGVPYKLYASAAGALGEHPAALAAWTVIGRASRFVLAIVLAAGIGRLLALRLSGRSIAWIWAAFWATTYATYWLA